jgi:hypothetical protein
VSKAGPTRRFEKALAALGGVPDPLERLDVVRQAREALETLEAQTVSEARAVGATWSEIGALYGVSKQAAQQRFRGTHNGAAGIPAHSPATPQQALVPSTNQPA